MIKYTLPIRKIPRRRNWSGICNKLTNVEIERFR